MKKSLRKMAFLAVTGCLALTGALVSWSMAQTYLLRRPVAGAEAPAVAAGTGQSCIVLVKHATYSWGDNSCTPPATPYFDCPSGFTAIAEHYDCAWGMAYGSAGSQYTSNGFGQRVCCKDF